MKTSRKWFYRKVLCSITGTDPLDPVIQLQLREAAAGGLDEPLVMLQPRMSENHQSSHALSSAFSHVS